ncbi:hypothetical protein SAMN05660284_02838 [Formivibrio citricus]|uniref:Uncharacterized protein n=1 Tax=Formivibrio citricus TaxID=83765 RepID=A0A1I5E5B8_9NEIS|nr:hypothetical protein [Formivibrio citricus]SFO06503.1 hypothetical protein SAMN05660284_02838 [Formivibrio citricus]
MHKALIYRSSLCLGVSVVRGQFADVLQTVFEESKKAEQAQPVPLFV